MITHLNNGLFDKISNVDLDEIIEYYEKCEDYESCEMFTKIKSAINK